MKWWWCDEWNVEWCDEMRLLSNCWLFVPSLSILFWISFLCCLLSLSPLFISSFSLLLSDLSMMASVAQILWLVDLSYFSDQTFRFYRTIPVDLWFTVTMLPVAEILGAIKFFFGLRELQASWSAQIRAWSRGEEEDEDEENKDGGSRRITMERMERSTRSGYRSRGDTCMIYVWCMYDV